MVWSAAIQDGHLPQRAVDGFGPAEPYTGVGSRKKRAADGDLTDIEMGHCFVSQSTDPAWWAVSLGAPERYVVERVVVTNAKQSCKLFSSITPTFILYMITPLSNTTFQLHYHQLQS